MTLQITSTKAAELEAQLVDEIANERANEAHFLEFVKDPRHKTQPFGSLSQIRESIEILELKHAEAKAAADAERAKLPTTDEARRLLAEAKDSEAAARKEFYAAVATARDALIAIDVAGKAHRATIGNGIAALVAAGIPREGAELDGEPIELRGRIEYGDTVLTAISEPISYKWAPNINRWVNKQ